MGAESGGGPGLTSAACSVTDTRSTPAPRLVVDTPAGAGLYRLDGDYAGTSGEVQDGLFKLSAALRPADGSAPAIAEAALAPAIAE